MNLIRQLAPSAMTPELATTPGLAVYRQKPEAYCPASCTLDVDEKFRFTLERRWERQPAYERLALWVMLNPSTASALKDDATIRRLNGFCKGWGLAGFDVLNLFALRSTDPKKLAKHYTQAGAGTLRIKDDQIVNNQHLLAAAKQPYAVIVFAWGAHGTLNDRNQTMLGYFGNARPMAFGYTKNGQPLHPLRLAASSKLYPWVAQSGRGGILV